MTRASRREARLLARARLMAFQSRVALAFDARRRGSAAERPSSPFELNTACVLLAAENLGVEVHPLPGGFLELSRDGKMRRAYGAAFEFEPLIPYLLCGDKAATADVLAEHGLPTVRHASFSVADYDAALAFFADSHKPVVLKPTRGTSSGIGVTLDVASEKAFHAAFARARAYCDEVQVEEQVKGEELRVTVLDQGILGVVRRIPAHVIGDGASPVRGLIGAKNLLWRDVSPENRLFRPLPIDRETRRVLALQGLELDSVPGDRDGVRLRELCNADQGGEIHNVESSTHGDHVAVALQAAPALGATLCGVDLIVPDIGAPGGDTIIEVNTTPSLYVINGMTDGSPSTRGTEEILRHLLELGPG